MFSVRNDSKRVVSCQLTQRLVPQSMSAEAKLSQNKKREFFSAIEGKNRNTKQREKCKSKACAKLGLYESEEKCLKEVYAYSSLAPTRLS